MHLHHLLFLTPLASLLSVTSAAAQGCAPQLMKLKYVGEPLAAKFEKDVCRQGMRPGGAQDVAWFEGNVVPAIKALAGNALPDDAWTDLGKLVKECHLDTYNYCNQGDRAAAKNCMQQRVLKFFPVPRVLGWLPTACPRVRQLVPGSTGKIRKGALQLFSAYCEMKGKTC